MYIRYITVTIYIYIDVCAYNIHKIYFLNTKIPCFHVFLMVDFLHSPGDQTGGPSGWCRSIAHGLGFSGGAFRLGWRFDVALEIGRE